MSAGIYKQVMRFVFPLLLLSLASFAADDYRPGPDADPREDVPRGEVKKMPPFANSAVFPGTTHEWQLYVPKQYVPAKPACVMIFFDGGFMRSMKRDAQAAGKLQYNTRLDGS